jgi:antitoxin component HigA of HigAB toxin-antitoxin module
MRVAATFYACAALLLLWAAMALPGASPVQPRGSAVLADPSIGPWAFSCGGPESCSTAPIRTKRDHEAALKEIERLGGAKTGTPEGDRLDVLATLVDAYEAEHYPMDPPDPIEAIKFRMEQQGRTRRDLEEIIGTRTRSPRS